MPKHENSDIGNDEIAALLSPFGVHLSADQISKVREYVRILLKWNNLTSLTSILDPAEIVARHFGESMYLPSILAVENGRLADVGSGAGFPGLALKILCQDLHVILIESNKKKCAFLSEVVRTLDLRGVEVLPVRFEDIRPQVDFANFVTARAVGGFPSLLRWARKALSARGHIALYVGGEDTTKISNTAGWTWQPAVRIPESQRRFILVGRPLPSDHARYSSAR
jgi:16S rRNA (guanine527-N7)-methyltransferase